MIQKNELPSWFPMAWRGAAIALSAAVFFFVDCLCAASTIKQVSIVLVVLILIAVYLFYGRMRERIKAPVVALALVVLMDGLSNLYAVSGKFAMFEFLKVAVSFCMVLLLLAFTGKRDPGRQAAEVLEGCCAIAGLVSIDLLSTRWISTPVLSLLEQFTSDYMNLTVVEDGVRITSIFMNPNVFAGCMGIGVLLSLGLAVSEDRPRVRCVHLTCLFVSSLSFVLAFSMGACAAILPAFLVLLALTAKDRRTGLLILMVETLLVAVVFAFPISLTSMTAWTGVRPIPLLCTAAGAAALCALDILAGRRLTRRLSGHGRAMAVLTAAILAAVVVFLIAACTLTTGVTLHTGDSLRRSAYPRPGDYTVTASVDGDPAITIESQNRADTMMHTSTLLYSGPLSQAAFTVPEDSLVVWFRFRADRDVRLDWVEFEGEGGSGRVPLGYRLLPGFISNRLQGLRANQNAIQRFVFFEDGLKLFRRSPVIGLGLGAFENGVRSVQSFPYTTKYAHNHYIQTLAETGIVGLVLFVALLAVSALAVWRGRKAPLAPALGAGLVFMACHGFVELVFSAYPYLPIAFGVFACINLCCGDAVPVPARANSRGVQTGILMGISALLTVFGILIGLNTAAHNIASQASDLSDLERAIALDPFERADYMLTYVVWTSGPEVDGEVRQKADGYAEQLGKINSNSIPIYLAEYYLETDRPEQGLAMAERYVGYVSSDPTAWQEVFDLLARYEQDTQSYRTGVVHIADLMDDWNEANMGRIDLNQQAQAFIARMRS